MKFDHAAFQVTDINASIDFYQKKLGFTLSFSGINEEEHEAYAFLRFGDANIELIQDLKNTYEKPEIRKPYCPHFCIEVDDIEKSLEALRNNGVNIVRGPLEIAGEEKWAYFSDIDNNILEYIQWIKKK